MPRTVYLDHHATTPLDQRALEAMLPYLREEFGNPSSTTHDYGHRAADAVTEARASLARLLNVAPHELIFTAGATESDNLAVKGGARRMRALGRGKHLVITAIEHKAVLLSAEAMEAEGFEVTIVSPAADGIIRGDDVVGALRSDTVLVSVMHANAEIGTVQPVAEVGAACRERGILLHCDATQTVGRIPVDIQALRCDLLSLSAHKFYGPEGVGALYVRDGVALEPLFSGGGQEGGLRSGTLNVPGIVGLGVLARLRLQDMGDEAERLTVLRNRLWEGIRTRIPGAHLNGDLERRLPGNLNVSFARCDGEAIILALDGFALSSGSACASGTREPSEVLLAIGRDPALARASVRFGLGPVTTAADLDRLVDGLEDVVRRLRDLAPDGV